MRKLIIAGTCLLTVVASCSKKTSAPTAAKEPAIDAASVFSTNCSRCHGTDGIGGKGPNLTKTDLTGNEIADVIRFGRGHMPEFNTKLNTGQIGAVAVYVERLKKQP